MQSTPETMKLALEAIAAMELSKDTNPAQLLVLCVTIARIELAKDFDTAITAIDDTIKNIQ